MRFMCFICLICPVSLWAQGDFFSLEAVTLQNKKQPFSAFKNKVILVVNTASKCGYTKQLGGLQKLYETYQKRGFLVLGFPSNDFKQEDLSSEKIADFCKFNFGVTFPMFKKSKVTGPQKSGVYQFLVQGSTPPGQEVSWNFEKFLVNRKGQVVARFRSKISPESKELQSAIEDALKS